MPGEIYPVKSFEKEKTCQISLTNQFRRQIFSNLSPAKFKLIQDTRYICKAQQSGLHRCKTEEDQDIQNTFILDKIIYIYIYIYIFIYRSFLFSVELY